ncbi:acetamidase/formamidase family protein [Dermatobacter hominis]|uniref:acetamidase/formamidase family protein n=1 Tax=Dermatobacter hominis TaxID=2884263 RepID=UPI001D12887F|nr:acetamidase/formamidase family protein [Dermatobacter hominis]UDY37385.1 acetamidase/formamidase family protein [Dermatobacter hominis]
MMGADMATSHLPPPDGVLHTRTGPVPGDRYVTATPDTLRWGVLPTPDSEPVESLPDGGTITFDTVSHEGLLGDQGADPVAFFGDRGIPQDRILDDVRELEGSALGRRLPHDGPHAVLGPVRVEGAQPGDVLVVEPLELRCRVDYGIISNRHGRGVLSGEMPLADGEGEVPDVVSVLARVGEDGRGSVTGTTGRRVGFDLAPFLGLVGVTPVEAPPGGSLPLSSTPPGPHGGNIDVRHLGVGSRLLLPVRTEGAGLYVGDPHYAQGNGEVALTAFEAPLRATLRVGVLRGEEPRRLAALLDAPWARTDEHTILIGLGGTLDEAMRECVRRAVRYVVAVTGLDDATALAFLSAAADFEVSQAVNLVVGVHCLIRTSDLA